MADQKISQLTTIVTVDTATDLFPIVDTSASETKKITPSALKTALALNNVDNTSDANKPISSATQTALDGKVDENAAIIGATKTKITYDAKGLVTAGADATTADIADSTNRRYVTDAQLVVVGNTSGTNTGDNATNSQYSGLATSKQDTLVSGTNIKTVNSTSLLGSGNVAVQETLVSGTNIKTVNSTSLLGSGDIAISASPSGVSGAIQFSNGSAFASDASNLFWDDTNNRLGIGTNAPTRQVEIVGSVATPAYLALRYGTATGSGPVLSLDAGAAGLNYQIISTTNSNGAAGANALGIFDGTDYRVVLKSGNLGIGETTPTARTHIKGSGTTSATTSLLVQNSGGTTALSVKDDLSTSVKILYIDNTIEGASSGRMNIISQYDLAIRPNNGGVGFAEGFGFNVNVSALIEMQSTTKGFLPPRMTTTQKNAIASPASGLIVYDTTTNKLCCYNGSTWNDLF